MKYPQTTITKRNNLLLINLFTILFFLTSFMTPTISVGQYIIDLVEFKATPPPAGGGIDIQWEAVAPKSSLYTIEELDADGNFVAIGMVDGANSFVDDNPSDGVNTYRLAQEDIDGEKGYSESLRVAYSEAAASIIIDLVEFKGTPPATGGGIGIEWVPYVSEPSLYTVERLSSDGNFVAIGMVDGANSFIDENPLDGINNYRLVQKDADEMITYSESLRIAYSEAAASIIIDLVEFKGTPSPEGEGIVLEWEAYLPTSSDAYSIERAGEDGLFVEIGVADVENAFLDEHPLEGMNHYRLTKTDDEGHVFYSNIIEVDHGEDIAIDLSPNPASQFLQVKYEVEKDAYVVVRMLDQNGNILLELTPNTAKGGHRHVSIDVRNYNPGLYFIHVINGSSTGAKIFTIQ